MTDTQPVTELLLELRGGGAEALDRLYPLVYDELRRIAGSGESGPPGRDVAFRALAVARGA